MLSFEHAQIPPHRKLCCIQVAAGPHVNESNGIRCNSKLCTTCRR